MSIFNEIWSDIADVTNFVDPGTPLDDEATQRGTSVYLVERRIDMLPKPLTEGTELIYLGWSLKPLPFPVWISFMCRYLFSAVWCGETSFLCYLGMLYLILKEWIGYLFHPTTQPPTAKPPTPFKRIKKMKNLTEAYQLPKMTPEVGDYLVYLVCSLFIDFS